MGHRLSLYLPHHLRRVIRVRQLRAQVQSELRRHLQLGVPQLHHLLPVHDGEGLFYNSAIEGGYNMSEEGTMSQCQ